MSNKPVTAKRILVVDDNRDAAVSLVQVLELLGHKAHGVFSGADALTEGPRFNPDIVFLDIGMPVLDGYACANKMRQTPWGQRATLVALTGWGQDEDREKSAQAGFNHHLVKPVDLDAVNALLM